MITDAVMIITSERNWGKEAQVIPYTVHCTVLKLFYNIQLFSDRNILTSQKKDWWQLHIEWSIEESDA